MSRFQFVTPMYRDDDPRGQGQLAADVLDDGRLRITVMPAPSCFASIATLPDADRERLRQFLNGEIK